jgi:hypothetical protein
MPFSDQRWSVRLPYISDLTTEYQLDSIAIEIASG